MTDRAPLYFEARLGGLFPASAKAEDACRFHAILLENQRPDGCANTTPSLTITSDRSARMANGQLPSPDELRQLLRYEPETGLLFWRARKPRHFPNGGNIGADAVCRVWNQRYAGIRAFAHRNAKGYLQGTVAAKKVEAHRVAWAVYHGRWPHEIDHIDGQKDNNRIANLREVNRQINSRNRSRRSDNSTGVTGVCLRGSKYVARIQADGKERLLGRFDTLAEAAGARKAAERELGYHPNHGRAV